MKKLLIILFILSLCVTFAEAQRPKVDEMTARELITTPLMRSGTDTVFNGTGIMADSIRLNNVWLKEWALSIGSGGYAANLYPTNQTSTIVGTYKKLSYTNDVTQVEKTIVVNNNEVLGETYLFELPIGTTCLDAGIWFGNLRFKVSSPTGVTQLKFEMFKRASEGTETTLFSTYTSEIEETAYTTKRTETNQPQYTVLATDRLGIRIYAKTTANTNITVYYIIGDGNASYFSTPLALRHQQLRGMTSDSVHLSVSQKKNLVSGTGTQNYLTKWGSSNTLTQSIAQDNGTIFTIGGNILASNIGTNATSNSTKIGIYAGIVENNTASRRNVFVGYRAGNNLSTGSENILIGASAGMLGTTHSYNCIIGSSAGQSNTGNYNTFIGYTSGFSNTSGERNTYIGRESGYSNSTGSGNVCIGNQAGRYNTGSNKLFINNNGTGSEAGDVKTSLMYGEFHTSVSNQLLVVNGKLTASLNINFGVDSGSTDDYSISISGINSYTTGLLIYFKANTLNTGACTINVNSLGAKALKMKNDQDPSNSYIESGSIVHAVYDGTNFQMIQPAAN